MEPNEFDHIEDSIRKAFDGFELPVSDADWNNIANALPESRKRRFAWFYRIFENGKLRFSLLILLFAGLSTGGYLLFNPKNGTTATSVETANAQKQQKDNSSTEASGGAKGLDAGPNSTTTDVAAGNSMPDAESSSANAVSNASDPTTVSRTTPGNLPHIGNPAIQPVADHIPAETAGTQQPALQKAPAMPPAFGIRFNPAPVSLSAPHTFPFAMRHQTPPETHGSSPNFYLAFNTMYAPGKLTPTAGSDVWKGYTQLGGRNNALNFRIEGGIQLGTGNTRFTAGASLEGNPAGLSSKDSVRIRIADKYLPYYDKNNNLLYMLAIRWRDSVITYSHNPQRVWAELPLGVMHTFDKGNYRISAGVTLNPGILLGSSDQMVNPYLYQSGSYWKYQGIQADTTNLMISSAPFINHYRLGSGVQLGVEKDMKGLTLGIHAQSRFYFTPVWKSGVPIRENNLQYGVQFRLGLKI